jgi:hypothetical protein
MLSSTPYSTFSLPASAKTCVWCYFVIQAKLPPLRRTALHWVANFGFDLKSPPSSKLPHLSSRDIPTHRPQNFLPCCALSVSSVCFPPTNSYGIGPNGTESFTNPRPFRPCPRAAPRISKLSVFRLPDRWVAALYKHKWKRPDLKYCRYRVYCRHLSF